MKILSNILVKAGVIVDNYIAIGTDSPYAGYNIDSRGSHNFGTTSSEVYHYFQSSSVSGGSAVSIGANNLSANSARSQLMLSDAASSVATRFGLGVYTGATPYAYLDSASKLVINNASGANVIIGGTTDAGYKLDVIGSLRASSLNITSPTYPTYPLTITYVASAQQRITGGYGSEWIQFGEGGNSLSLKANEIYYQSSNNVFSPNASIISSGLGGLNFKTSNFYQQGDTRFGYQFYADYTGAVASGVSTLGLVGFNPIIQTTVGTIDGSILSINPTINTTGGTTNWSAIYYNPTVTGTTGLTHYFINALVGKVKLGDLAGSGTRMVVADANGLLSTQSFSANVNAFQEYTYTATAGQTTFAATYTVGQVFVFYNGSKLEPAEYTATDGTSIVITPGVNAGDIIDIIAYQTGAGIGYGSLSVTGPLTYNNTTGVFAIQQASGSQAGFLSSADWTTFNNKQNALTNPVTGTGTANYHVKWTATGTVGNSLIFDNGSAVGINTTSVSGTYGKLSVAGGISILDDNNAKLEIGRYSSGTANSYIKLGANSSSLRITNNTDTSDIFTITNAGYIGMGVTPNIGWNTIGSAIQMASYASFFSGDDGFRAFTAMGFNMYNSAAWSPRYILTGSTASVYRQRDGSHEFYTAASGTAGNAISFTRTMAIMDNGDLYLGPYHSTAKFCPGADTNHFMRYNSSLDGIEIGGYSGISFTTLGSTERMRLLTNGNLAIGSTNAANRLQVEGGNIAKATTFGYDGAVDNMIKYGARQDLNASGQFLDRWIGIDATITAGGGSGNVMYFKVYSGGGSGSPRTSAYFNGDGSVFNYNNTTTWQQSSDARIKSNINTLENAVSTIAKLNPVSFEYTDSFIQDKQWDISRKKGNIGFIAQEFEKVFPAHVHLNMETIDGKKVNDFRTIDTGHLVPIIVKAIQEEDLKIQNLEAKVAAQQTEIELLKAQLGTN